MDFTDFGLPSAEWQRFVAAHPEAGAPAALPPDQTDAEIQSATNAEREETSERLFRAAGLDSAVRIEEVEIRRPSSSTTTNSNGSSSNNPATHDRRAGDPDSDGNDGLTARIYTRVLGAEELALDSVPAVVYLHGGGHVFGAADAERRLCGLVAARLRVVVVHVRYREAPRHAHPAAHRDGRDGFEWVARNAGRLGVDPDQIVIVGLSCGAGIAASTCLSVCSEEGEGSVAARDEQGGGGEGDGPGWKVFDRNAPPPEEERRKKGRIKGLLLCFPWLLQESSFPYHRYRCRDGASRVQCAQAPGMSKAVYDRLTDMMGAEDPADPLLNVPLAKYTELARFPRTAFIIAGMDMFRDDALLFAEKLRALGVPRRVHMFPGMPHGFRKYDELWSSRRFDELLLLLINWALDRTVSSMDVGFHIEQHHEEGNGHNRGQKPPFVTRYET